MYCAVSALQLSTMQLGAYELGLGEPSMVMRLPLRVTPVAHPLMMELYEGAPAGRSAAMRKTVAFVTPRPEMSSGFPDTTPVS